MSELLGGLGLLADWSRWYEATGRGKADTARAYRRAILVFFADVLPGSLAEVSEDMCFSYLLTLTPNRRNDIGRALLSFFGWCADRGHLPQGNPMRDYLVHRVPPGRVRYLSEEQLMEFFISARNHRDDRAHPTFALLLGTGARIGSVVGARCEDIDLTPGSEAAFWRVAKNGRTYSSALTPEYSLPAARKLLALAEQGYTLDRGGKRDRELLVGVRSEESVRVWMREIAKSAGIPKELAHPHALRRTFGTFLARSHQTDLATWVACMGHSDGNSFVRYSAADDRRVRSALALLPSIGPD